MMVINNNIPALNAYDIVNSTSNQLQKSIQKLSTGLRINSAADDAAGLSISEKMRAQINGLDQAVRNTQDGVSLIQTAEGALTETHSILQRMRELSVQAANDTYTAQDRSYIQEEVDLLRDEIDHIGNTTTFNTKKLLNGDSAVLWSSDNLNTKAIVNGGLRNIDQFGQKSSAEGNYKITVKADAGVGEVQKTDIFKIKHDLDPYVVAGSNDFHGAALEGESAPDWEAVGGRTFTITTADNVAVSITLHHEITDTQDLADAINAAYGNTTDDTTAPSTNALTTTLGDVVEVTNGTYAAANHGMVASVGNDGSLVLTNAGGQSFSISDGTDDSNNDLVDVFGVSSNSTPIESDTTYGEYWGDTAAEFQNTAWTTGNIATTANNVALKITASAGVDDDGNAVTGEKTIDMTSRLNALATANSGSLDTAANLDAIIANLNAALDEVYKDGSIYFTRATDLDSSATADVVALVSNGAGTLTIDNGGNSGTLNLATTLFGTVPTAATNTKLSVTLDDTARETNFQHTMAGAKINIVTGGKNADITVSDDVTDVDLLVMDLNTQIAESDVAGLVTARKVEDSSGNEVVRLFSESDLTVTDATNGTDEHNEGSVNAIFGTGLTTGGASDATKTTVAADATKDVGDIEDKVRLLKSTDTYSFKIMEATSDVSDDEDPATIATISLKGPFAPTYDKTTGKVTKTASQALVDEINSQITTQLGNSSGFKAAVIKDSDGNETVKIFSATRDFTLKSDDEDYSFAQVLGLSTNGEAETSKLEEDSEVVESIGMVANSTTKLRDLDKFWDSQGNFLLDDPQTITITQGDGKTANVTLYKYDTLGEMASKLNNAIANDLGQAKYLSDADDADNFVTFVDTPTESGLESVQGTMIVRTIVPGSSGTLNFASNNEDLINALSLNTIQKADDSVYYVTVQDAHTGNVVNGIEDEKITGNVLVGRLHPNVDVEFDAQTGVTATWDDNNNTFVMQGTYSGAETDTGEVTYLHLTDNTMVFQIGANEGDDMGINIGDMRSHALGLDGVLVTDRDSASRSISIIDSAIDKVSTQRAKLGAYQNRLEHTAANLTTSSENLTAAESRIRDADMAKEMMNFTKLQIMLQAGNSMLAQANQLPQNVLSLIR